VYELFLDLDATRVRSSSDRLLQRTRRTRRVGLPTIWPPPPAAFDPIVEHIPAPTYEDGHPLQALVTTISTRHRTSEGSRSAGRAGLDPPTQPVAWCRADGSVEKAKATELYVTEALDRVEADEAGPARSSPSRDSRGDDRRDARDPDDPRPLPVIR
jgi:GTP-binding protein